MGASPEENGLDRLEDDVEVERDGEILCTERLQQPHEQLAAVGDRAQVVEVGEIQAHLADPGDEQRLEQALGARLPGLAADDPSL